MIRQIQKDGAVIEYELKYTKRRSLYGRSENGAIKVFAPANTPAEAADEYVLNNLKIIKLLETHREMEKTACSAALRLAEKMAKDPLEVIEG